VYERSWKVRILRTYDRCLNCSLM